MASGTAGRVDETYVKVAGKWRYVYRAIDQFGQVIDVFVTPQRDAKAARRFFERAFNTTKVMPVEVSTDRAATYPVYELAVEVPAGQRLTVAFDDLALAI